MLSIIISSYQPLYYSQLVKNISETIGDGFSYEIIQILNPNFMSITKAYNDGAEKAQYDHLLFLHEDLIFYTQNWGNVLAQHLSDDKTGIIGVAGSSYVPHAPSSWTVSEKYNFFHLLQGNKNNDEYVSQFKTSKKRNPVFAVDGVFVAIKKENYIPFKFDQNLTGFHGYDLDFSLRVSEKFQNFVVDDILIQHFSKGNQDQNWLDATIKVRENLNIKFNLSIDSETETNIFEGFLYQYFKFYPINFKNILFSLKFYPFKHLKFAQHLFLMKKYYQLMRYSKDINKKHR